MSGSLCTGYGGLDLAAEAVLGAVPAWCADNDRYVTAILAARLPGVPNLGDLTAVDWRDVPRVDLVTAGFPCQDISVAGRGAGLRKETRSGLWFTIAGALRLLRPSLVFLENVAALRTRGLPTVLGDLAALGYDTTWLCLRASDIGAPHRRERMFILAANPNGVRLHRHGEPGARGPVKPDRRDLLAADALGVQCQRLRTPSVLAGSTSQAGGESDTAAEYRCAAAAHSSGQRQRNSGAQGGDRCREEVRGTAVGGAAADTARVGRGEGQPQPARRQGRPDTHLGGPPDWGPYTPAVLRWETVLGRPAPLPTEPGRHGQPRLSARYVEWMMGLPDGWVTDLDIPRSAQMRALGNGVVPQQAELALVLLTGLLVEPRQESR